MKSTKNKTTIKQAAEILKNSDDIALFSHIRPDGDTVGAAVALCLALKKWAKGKPVLQRPTERRFAQV